MMGHANVRNLSDLFVNLLYAKGRISINDAVKTAIKRKESLHASEGDYDDEGMLEYAFTEIVGHLISESGVWFGIGDSWAGPWIEPEFRKRAVTYNVRKVPESTTVKNLLLQCANAIVHTNVVDFLKHENLFGVCADAIQDLGDEEWAGRVRRYPRQFCAWKHHLSRDWKYFDDEQNADAFASIKWVFVEGCRKRYRKVPRLGSISN